MSSMFEAGLKYEINFLFQAITYCSCNIDFAICHLMWRFLVYVGEKLGSVFLLFACYD